MRQVWVQAHLIIAPRTCGVAWWNAQEKQNVGIQRAQARSALGYVGKARSNLGRLQHRCKALPSELNGCFLNLRRLALVS